MTNYCADCGHRPMYHREGLGACTYFDGDMHCVCPLFEKDYDQ